MMMMMMMKAVPSKALVIRINLVFLAFFLVIYAALLLRPFSSAYNENSVSLVRCSLQDCHGHKGKGSEGIKMKAVLEETPPNHRYSNQNRTTSNRALPSFMKHMGHGIKMGMINMEDEDMAQWSIHGQPIQIPLNRVSNYLEWKDIFPEWIDEEEEIDGPACPEIPMPDFEKHRENLDVVVVKLPCKYPEEGWGRDVYRLQVHLAAAKMAVRRGRRGEWKRKGRVKVVVLSKCRPMLEVFRCEDLVEREDEWWFFQPEVGRLEEKVALPVGSCELALPLWAQGVDNPYDVSKIRPGITGAAKRQAYATVLHSSESYVCGAITLAQSLRRSGTNRDLVMLLDASISAPKRAALAAAGWKIRMIKRIRNPRAKKGTYNEYNYSKFRLWQLADYEKVIFIDSDIVILKNLDLLFNFPQMSAAGNDGSIFNSGVMVLEPSECTFRILMGLREKIRSYNGGDQGFLNEVFVWWHRLPRRVNFLKNFWSNSTVEAGLKNQLFGSEPAKLYAIHYIGLKPWLCYRDYDCNWDIGDQRVYASDVAHGRWWKVHDAMEEGLQRFCRLTERRKFELEWDRNKAKKAGLPGEYWKINVTDPRKFV